ncbi:MAG: DMT family transporter [Patescibacteria group bacterium]
MEIKLKQFKKWLRDSTKYSLYLIGLLIFWAVVPAFSKLGNYNGLQKTFWINGFAVVVLLLIFWVKRFFEKKVAENTISLFSLLKVSLVGIVWPFLYSILYFQSIYLGSPSLTTLIGRVNILVYAPILVIAFKKKEALSRRDIILMTVSVIAVGIALSSNLNSNSIYLISILMAFGATLASGIYTAIAEIWRSKYSSLFFTLVIEFITFLFAAIFTFFTKSFIFPAGKDLFYLAFIGIFSNALAFWFFLKGFQIATKLGNSHKVIFLVFQSSILTFAQITVIWLLKAESISITTVLGAVVLSLGLLWYGLSAKVKN